MKSTVKSQSINYAELFAQALAALPEKMAQNVIAISQSRIDGDRVSGAVLTQNGFGTLSAKIVNGDTHNLVVIMDGKTLRFQRNARNNSLYLDEGDSVLYCNTISGGVRTITRRDKPNVSAPETLDWAQSIAGALSSRERKIERNARDQQQTSRRTGRGSDVSHEDAIPRG